MRTEEQREKRPRLLDTEVGIVKFLVKKVRRVKVDIFSFLF